MPGVALIIIAQGRKGAMSGMWPVSHDQFVNNIPLLFDVLTAVRVFVA